MTQAIWLLKNLLQEVSLKINARAFAPNALQVRSFLCDFLIFLVVVTSGAALAEEGGNCLLCHKMPGFGIYEKDANNNKIRRMFNIDEQSYENSYHGRVNCLGCHSDIDQIPHQKAKIVDCSSECHIRDPSSNGWYSHQTLAKDLNESVHGKKIKNANDYPECRNCHTNKPYQSTGNGLDEIDELVSVCLQCHESEEWTKRFFKHINYRARIRRSSKDIVALCSSCHTDGAMMGRHGLDVVVGFNDTFHGKAIKYGNSDVANCLNCHAPYKNGFSPHSIISQEDNKAPVSQSKKLETCRQSGCHIDAKEAFAIQGKVHPSSYGLVSWMRPSSNNQTQNADDDFQNLVIYLINLFYKFLIVIVVGGLGIHQILNLRAIKRDMKRDMTKEKK